MKTIIAIVVSGLMIGVANANLFTNGIPTDGPQGFMRLNVKKTD